MRRSSTVERRVLIILNIKIILNTKIKDKENIVEIKVNIVLTESMRIRIIVEIIVAMDLIMIIMKRNIVEMEVVMVSADKREVKVL